MIILNSWWINAANTQAMAMIDTRNQALAYHPTDASKTHHSINEARDAGTLTGQIDPTPYTPPEPISEPTPKENRASAYTAECDPILVQIYGYELEKEITKSTAKDATIAALKTLWKSTRDAIRARYPDEG